MKNSSRTSPEFLKNSVVYQIFLRPFTPEGTIKSAARLLPHLAELGIDIVYLCPVCLQDDDQRPEFWSDRQNKSGIGNPQNPYRIKDYFNLDPEYGTDADLKDFIGQVHALGMKVLLDLVYYHCGPTAVFIEAHPDFVKRDPSGAVINGRWHFPELNFESPALREYLWQNMEYFIKEFNVDGYRCDVAPAVPLDFWEEARRRMESLNPEFIMISEGDRVEDQLSAFDLNYGFAWEYKLIALFKQEATAKDLQAVWQKMHDEFPSDARFLRILDNHDIANDCGLARHEHRFGVNGVEAALLINFVMDGVPFLYNGQEIADAAVHSIYGNRFYGKNMMIDWSNAMTVAGRKRLAYIRTLSELKHSLPALADGVVKWLDNDQPETVVSFTRECVGQRLLLAVNASGQPLTTAIQVGKGGFYPKSLLQQGSDYRFEDGQMKVDFLPYGYLLLEY